MATYTDVTRTSRQECTFTFTNIKSRRWQPLKVLPPEQYIHNTDFSFTVGQHYGNYATIELLYLDTQVNNTSPWNVNVYAKVTVWCGITGSAVVTQNVLLFSQTAIPVATNYYDVSIGSISGTYTFTVGSEIKWDINETATSVLDLPAYTQYTQYERNTTGSTANCSVVINGITTASTGTVSTPFGTNYQFQANITKFIKDGSLSDISNLLIQSMTTNQIAVPSYNHLNVINSNFYAKHTGSSIDCKNIGTDDAFGDPFETNITMSSMIKLETNLKSLGKINAFDASYPDPLTIAITGFDNSSSGGTGTRIFTATGSWEQNDTWKNYNISSNVGGTILNTGPYNNYGTNYKTVISSGLSAAGDDPKYTRLYLRGFNFPGASMILSNELEITGGTGNTRTYAGLGKQFNSYRYLELEIKSNTGTTQNDTLTLTCQPGSDVKSWPISVTSSTYVRYRIDLLTPNNKTIPLIDNQDNPYPRKHPTDNTYASQEIQNSSWFGVNRVTGLSIANTNITLNRIFLVADTQSEKSNYIFPPEYYVKVQNDSNSGTTYLGRRFWTQLTSGKLEEEYDVLNTGGTKSITTINDFVNRVNNNHPGWTASATTTIGTGIRAYANSINGYSFWLGGITWKADTGGGTVQKDFINVSQNQGEADTDTLAQTIFDEFITNEIVPDYSDPFGVYKQNTPPLITIPSMTILRGIAHGQVLATNYTPLFNKTVDLLLSSNNSNRGQGVTNLIGNYQTNSPRGLSYKNHTIYYSESTASSNVTPLYAAKMYRCTFITATAGADNVSADLSAIYQHLIGYVDGGTVKLLTTKSPNFSTFITTVTNVTAATTVAVRWKKPTNNNEIILDVGDTTGNIKKYIFNNGLGVATLATTLGTGTFPALALDDTGIEYHFFRTTDSGGSIKLVVLSPTGSVIRSAALVVTGNVADKGIAAYCRNNDIYLVYSHTTNGITVVRSNNTGGSFS